MSDELNKRNTAAFDEAIKDLTAKAYSQQEQINSLLATLGSMQERLHSLDQTIALLRAATTSRGASVK